MRERRWTPRPPGPVGQGKPRGRAPSQSNRTFRPRPRAADGPALLYGWHTVKAALENPHRRFRRVLATENDAPRLAEHGVKVPKTPEPVRATAVNSPAGRPLRSPVAGTARWAGPRRETSTAAGGRCA